MILVHDILYKLNIDLCLSKNKIWGNGGYCERCKTPMKDISKTNFNMSSNFPNQKMFHNKELYESDHVMDAT